MSEKQHYRVIALWLGLVGGPGCLSACGDTTSVDPESEPCSESEPTEGAVCVRQVTGRLLDTDGEPPPDDSLVTVCGPTCFASATEADGSFTVSVDAYLVLDEYSTLLHGAPTYSGFYFAIPGDAEGPDLDVGELTVFRLPEQGPRIPDTVTEPLELESDGVTLRLPAGLETKFEVAAFGEGELGKQFRAVEIGAEDGARVTGDLEGVFAYYAFDPFESFFIEAGVKPESASNSG